MISRDFWTNVKRGESRRRKSRAQGKPVLLSCRLGLHSWCHQSGFAEFYFCNFCGKGWPTNE